MLKKMRWRFIWSSMIAFAVVMTLLIAGINLITYFRTTVSQIRMVSQIADYRAEVQETPDENHRSISQMPWAPHPDGEFTVRFFAVECTTDGKIQVFDKEYISSVDEDTAKEYASTILAKQRTAGIYLDYRYLVQEHDDSITVTFLNIADAKSSQQALLMTSLIIWAGSLLFVFALVVLFSKKAITPFLKNLEQQRQFITDAGHELKTPVTSIITSADILAAEGEDNEWLENIQAQSHRLTKLVNNLVLLSRMNEETPCPERSVFSLSEAVWETAENFQAQFKACGKNYTQSIEENILLTGDKSSIQKMLSILLDNAVRYSVPSGEIFLKLFKAQKKIYLEISNACESDSIPDPKRLFDRFYRPDSSRVSHTGGSGIGLSIAKSIVENHKGIISATIPVKNTIVFRIVF